MMDSFEAIEERWTLFLEELKSFGGEGYPPNSSRGAHIAYGLTMEKLNILMDLLKDLRDYKVDPHSLDENGFELWEDIENILCLSMSTCPYCKLSGSYCEDCLFSRFHKNEPGFPPPCLRVSRRALDKYTNLKDDDFFQGKIKYLEAFMDWFEEHFGKEGEEE